MAVPTLGWALWHPIWWLQTLLAHSTEQPVPSWEEVEWPGPDRSLPKLRSLWADWTELVGSLEDSELGAAHLTRFPYADDRPFIHIVGWASMELTKNLGEMCLQRRLQDGWRRQRP